MKRFSVFQLWVVSVVTINVVCGQHLACEDRSPEGHSAIKRSGDGGFQIIVTGKEANRGFYIPNEVYTVKIQGVKTRYSNQKFTEFLIVAESEKQATMGHTGLVTTGILHIIDDTQTRFSDNCPDGVTNLRPQPKTEVSVLWSAPSVLVASCITFKVTLVERPQFWYMDDGNLTKVLCPEFPFRTSVTTTPPPFTKRELVESLLLTRNIPTPNPNYNFQPHHLHHQPQENAKENMLQNIMRVYANITAVENAINSAEALTHTTTNPNIKTDTIPQNNDPDKCCACDEAKYEVIFEGLWSRETHPKDFPENEWLLHFSDIIGASHSRDYYFWKVGEQASEGIRQVAEWGATRHLENELKSKSRHINTIIKARGLWHPNEQGRTSAAFRVDKNHHLMSLVSMIGPSPDWFVGISGFELCMKNCTWLPEASYNLYPFDAGTDAGISYMSPNLNMNPRDAIKEITATDPADARSPFFEVPGNEPMKPFAKVYIRRQRIYPKDCNESSSTSDASHEIIFAENTEEVNRPECAVSEWTAWSDCSVLCGKGLRMRKRSYIIPMKAQMMSCDRQLVEKEMCLGKTATCEAEQDEFEEVDSICVVTEWSNWTPCSVTCGHGTRTRNRRYKNHLGRKKCTLTMTETEQCVGVKERCSPTENREALENDPDCPLTHWSAWSPCSVTCGSGVRERSRSLLFVEDEVVPGKCSPIELHQRVECIGDLGADCTIGVDTAKEICMLAPDSGSCRADLRKYYFHTDSLTCTVFSYGGCKGNRNRFDTMEECNEVCGFLNPNFNALRDSANSNNVHQSSDRGREETRGNNLELGRRRAVPTAVAVVSAEIYEPENAGNLFPAKVDCVVSDWSEWSPCSVTCGVGTVTRSRTIQLEPQNGGRRCPRKLSKVKPCRLPSC